MHTIVVLNRNYEYNGEVTLKKVLKWIVKDKIEILAEKEDEEIRAIEFRIKMPMVVRLLNFVGYKIKSDNIPYSNQAIYNRDNNICQYWHDYVLNKGGKIVPSDKPYRHRCTENDRTIDHVIPRAYKGVTDFENCVCSCRTCNELIKKNKTPKEAGMRLIREPRIPVSRKGQFAVIKFAFNDQKPAHRFYLEGVLQSKFNPIV